MMADVSRRTFVLSTIAILLLGLTLRSLWLRSDPPVRDPVGIVWHDEGPWVHNARNRALWGTWITDNWNPVFLTPVFTALEYASFERFGVGTWQARVVPVVSGMVAIAALMLGVAAVAGRRAALVAGLLLAVNYEFTMWNRAALMESTVTAFLVCAWAAAAWSDRRPGWGLAAGVATALAWFTKANAAFFVAAIGIDAVARLWWSAGTPEGRAERRAATCTLIGLAGAGGLITAAFVLPHWREYAFYNWHMSVERKPEYSLEAFQQRVSWLPFVHGVFSRMSLVVVTGLAGLVGITQRWRHESTGARLLVLWMAIGLLELVVHDSGNERRYVMFIPALIALAALVIGRVTSRATARAPQGHAPSWTASIVGLGVLLPVGYLIAGTLLRPFFMAQLADNDYHMAVRLSAAGGVLIAAAAWASRDRLARQLQSWNGTPAILLTIVVVTVTSNAAEYVLWARTRGSMNYDASVALGRALPAGTLVQGKLANGMALENRIRPLFVGNGFGNYEDRLRRDDVRYILTYDLPQIGYESQRGSRLIPELIEQYPNHRTIATFEVDETPGPDRAVLIDKDPAASQPHAHD